MTRLNESELRQNSMPAAEVSLRLKTEQVKFRQAVSIQKTIAESLVSFFQKLFA